MGKRFKSFTAPATVIMYFMHLSQIPAYLFLRREVSKHMVSMCFYFCINEDDNMTKRMMFQGTASSVGKSILTAGMCRILMQDGIKVAPFKAQNMALNSFVTKEGLEMGRAQVVQAEAAGLEPDVLMNPILIKPTSDTGSQVIVHGKVSENMDAKTYHAYKEKLKKAVKSAYDELEQKYEAIIMEGAGSPAEINLRENDLVNMGMANMSDSKVILIGDIDRGGVFASVYGTYMLLNEEERSRICGYIINKFRGDVNLLKPGIEMLKEYIPLPCLGVMPYIKLEIDDEDSVTDRFKANNKGKVKVSVIRLPYISNFTDFSPLELEPDLEVIYATKLEQVIDADLIIVPGSKNTLSDMKYLHDQGFVETIIRKNRMGTPVIGICGGYQMLGEEIIDENCVESQIKRINGIGLLPVKTEMELEKHTTQTIGNINEENKLFDNKKFLNLKGYEIHMGKTELLSNEIKPFINTINGRFDGAYYEKRQVLGTYMHGIFDNDELRKALIDTLLKKKGFEIKKEALSINQIKEDAYNRLADTMREHLDIDYIYKEMGF